MAPKKKGERETSEKTASRPPERLEEIRGLVARAKQGDKEVVPELRAALKEMPELARRYGHPAEKVEQVIIEKYVGENLLAKEAISRTLKLMREELAGVDPTLLERLLTERVVATWLQLQFFEQLHFHSIGKLTDSQDEYHQKRIDRVHKRHLSAVRTLAQVRKLLKPGGVNQINIADQQVNVAGEPPSSR